MTIDLTHLDAPFVAKIQLLMINLQNEQLNFVPYYGIRTLAQQASLYRQSRHTSDIEAKIANLRLAKADYLADALENVGPQPIKPWATDAIPGYSWHNWGQAVDFYFLDDNNTIQWNGKLYYPPLGRAAKELGLRWGGDFTTPDWGHVQFNQQEIPDLYSLQYVNDYFKGQNAQ